MEEPSQKVAIRTLQVLLSTRRKLSLDEMLAAVTVDIDTNEALVSTVDELLDVCWNLIIFDEEERILRFAHLSVREFLEECAPRDHFSIQSRELFLMNRCLYIFLCKSRHVIIFKDQADEIVRQNERFITYAAKYWPEHCGLGQPDVVTSKLLREFIGNDLDKGYSASYVKWFQKVSRPHGYESQCFLIKDTFFDGGNDLSIFFTSCIYGLMAIIMTLLPFRNIDWNAPIKVSRGEINYPLVYAAKEGHEMIVRQFLSRYSGHYAKGCHGHEILFVILVEAIRASQIEVVKTLLDSGKINVNDTLPQGLISRYKSYSLLGIAIMARKDKMVKFLLHSGANINGETGSGLSYTGRVNYLEILKDEYASEDVENSKYKSPLRTAVLECSPAIVDVLCSFGADVMAKDSSGATLIHFLAERICHPHLNSDFRAIVWYLIRKGVDIASVDNSQCTALHVAACRKYEAYELIPVLFDAGTPINAQNSGGDTALNITVVRFLSTDMEKCAFRLLSLGADCSIRNNNGLTALDIAEKWFKGSYAKYCKQRSYKRLIEYLTIASQDKIVEDIRRLFVDDS